MLICRIDGDRQIALPLGHVVCLEQVPFSMVKHSATGDVMPYRGGVLRLHHLSQGQAAAVTARSESDLMTIVIYSTGDTQLGLVVDHIVDVTEQPADLCAVDQSENSATRHSVIGMAVVLGQVTEFLQVI